MTIKPESDIIFVFMVLKSESETTEKTKTKDLKKIKAKGGKNFQKYAVNLDSAIWFCPLLCRWCNMFLKNE